jgi:hypothetical protein
MYFLDNYPVPYSLNLDSGLLLSPNFVKLIVEFEYGPNPDQGF